MPKELKTKTIIFVSIIVLLSIILTLITKSAILTLDIIISICLLSFFYIRYYPTHNLKKEVVINKLALFMAVIYMVALVIVGALEIFLLS